MANKLARYLRRNMTDAERRLWTHLRRLELSGARFRRQQPLGTYIVDFVCFEAKLVVEVDGDQHAVFRRAHDARRDDWLRSQGFEVLRFWNVEVFKSLDRVLDEIALAIEEARRYFAYTESIRG